MPVAHLRTQRTAVLLLALALAAAVRVITEAMAALEVSAAAAAVLLDIQPLKRVALAALVFWLFV
jgi:hypothetical protein